MINKKGRMTIAVISVIILIAAVAIYLTDRSKDNNIHHTRKLPSLTRVSAISAVKSKQYTWSNVSATYAEISVIYALLMYSKINFKRLSVDEDPTNKKTKLVIIEFEAKEVMPGVLDPVQMFPNQWDDPISYQPGVVPSKEKIRKMQEKIRQSIPLLRMIWRVAPSGTVSPANYYSADSLKFFRQYIKPRPKALLQRKREDIDSLLISESEVDARWKLILSNRSE